VHGNQATNGGGLLNAGGETHIVESSISGNRAQESGGALLNQAQLTLENVTLSGNQANTGGGLMATGGNAELLYVTLAGNSAANAGGGIHSSGNLVRIENTLLAGNDAPVGPDCTNSVLSGGHNLIASLKDCALSGSTSGNVVGQSPLIDVLTGNAAQTYSHPLLAGSPAIGRATCLLAMDQSGAQRPTEAGCDIGAFEASGISVGVYMPIVGKE
jgi:predicted outer membrane repeat protein